MRAGGVLLFSWGLLTLDKKFWFLATGLIGFWLFIAVSALFVSGYFVRNYDDLFSFALLIAKILVPLYLLAHTFYLLLSKQTRDIYFKSLSD